ncbi:MAG: T9SS type A sorting domain-containing protein [Flavobacteriales bacterium]|nr:MAG: T9SS type A sorting domain-containing protein [Flavobacteriales bacterium]
MVVDDGFVATWTCSPDGIVENSAPSFHLSPVPADDVLNVFFAQRSDATLTIMNALGAVLEQRAIASATERTIIDVSAWPAGLYALALSDNSGRSTKTFVVR